MADILYDIQSDNFELYFDKQLDAITPKNREFMPKSLAHKLYSVEGKRRRNGGRIPFATKLWILWRLLKKRIWIVVEDQDGGIGIEDFVKLREAKKLHNHEIVDDLMENATFVTGDKDLCYAMQAIHGASASPHYNYINRTRNRKDIVKSCNTEEAKKQLKFICKFLQNYEAIRKDITVKCGLAFCEWLVLIHLYHIGKETTGSTIYREIYRRGYNSSENKIRNAFITLQQNGFIRKIGLTRGAKFEITALGIDAVHRVMNKLVLPMI